MIFLTLLLSVLLFNSASADQQPDVVENFHEKVVKSSIHIKVSTGSFVETVTTTVDRQTMKE